MAWNLRLRLMNLLTDDFGALSQISTAETTSSDGNQHQLPVQCPQCEKRCPRPENGHRTVCATCSKIQKKVFLFCWACRRKWQGSTENRSCSLPGCELRAALLSTETITHLNSSVYGCPFFRACPICQTLLTHTGQGCKMIQCPVCTTDLCFRCLKTEFGHRMCNIVDNSSSLRALNV